MAKDICWILDTLSKEYPEGAYPGRSSEGLSPRWQPDPFHVLIATILSQRTRDDNTRKASDALFSEYDSLKEIAEADVNEIERLIRPAGFPAQKAKALRSACNEIMERFDSRVPSGTDDLLSLPMVGRKTAACVRSYAFGIPAVCVDTHVHRISNLMGLVHTKDPEATEYELMRMTPKERWSDINRYMVRHGQVVCLPNNPKCERCSIRMMCDAYLINEERQCTDDA